MTTPCSGAISLNDVRVELGRSNIVTLNDTDVRTLAGKPSGIIKLSDLYCKTDSETGWHNSIYPASSGTSHNDMVVTNLPSYPALDTLPNFPDLEDHVYKVFDNSNVSNIQTLSSAEHDTYGGAGIKVYCKNDVYITAARFMVHIDFENTTGDLRTAYWVHRAGVGVSKTVPFNLFATGASDPVQYIGLVYSYNGALEFTSGMHYTFTPNVTTNFPSTKIGNAGETIYIATTFDFDSANSYIVSNSFRGYQFDYYLSGI